ncbi:hypothetical protein [Microbacterium sp. NPDC090003]|uniref:hypothetical protein n=1 Tax=Microbacterium sp. NPDC090003 TaxID=3364203 RepID=UPI0037FD984C
MSSGKWGVFEGSKKSIVRAGKVLRNPGADPAERAGALTVAEAWRRAHAYPMNTWQIRVRRYAKGIEGSSVVQRLKRMPSIEKKLQRFDNMQLSTIQDLGGVRVIVPRVADVRMLQRKLLDRPGEHQLTGHEDYLTSPKPDGYRSVHLVHAYGTRRSTPWEGLRVEVQIRTRIQHTWATAVETVDLFTGQRLKSGAGDEWWREFFALMSGELAAAEGLPAVPGVSADVAERRKRLQEIQDEFDVLKRLSAFRHVTSDGSGYSGKFLVLDLDIRDTFITINSFPDRDEAIRKYESLERHVRDNPYYDILFVAIDDVDDLKEAYPNYFADLRDFINLVENAISLKRYGEDEWPWLSQ